MYPTYDSADCVVELASKGKEWRCAASACLPTPVPQTSLHGQQNPHLMPTQSTPSVKQPVTPPR